MIKKIVSSVKSLIIMVLLASCSTSRSDLADGNFYSLTYDPFHAKYMSCGFGVSDPEFVSVWAVVRYNPNGTLDPTFGFGGYVIENGLGTSAAYGLTIDDSGNSYVGGWALVNGLRTWTVIKYTITGARDTTFNGTGMVQETALGVAEAYSISLSRTLIPQVIYVTGYTNIDNHPVMTIISYNQDGTHNATFNP